MNALIENLMSWAKSDFLIHFNTFAWIASNMLLAYTTAVILLFVIMYYIWYDPKATTAGRFVFRFMVSLLGVMALVYIASYLDPTPGRHWNEFPGDVLWWRPGLRLAVYTYVAFSITALSVVLVMRKFWPHRLTTADKETLRARNDK